VLHRDIKAQNVMLADDGRPVLMDFGTGRELADNGADVAGTPLYLAPEILAGADATVQSDVYSLGVLLYYLVTGSYPVRAETASDLHRAHQRHERIRVRTSRRGSDLSPKLARIMERAIDPQPDGRYASARALASDLATLQRRPMLARLPVAIAAAVLLLMVGWGWEAVARRVGSSRAPSRLLAVVAGRDASAPGRAIPALERLTNDGTVRLAAVSADGRDLAYVRRDGVRESLWLKTHETSTAARLLEPRDGTFRSLTFAGGETLHYMFFRPDKTAVRPFRLSTHGGSTEALLEPAGRLSFNRDGSLCAYIATFSLMMRESRLIISDPDGKDSRIIAVRRPPQSFLLTTPAWAPDGTRLAVFGSSENAPGVLELLIVDVKTGATSHVRPLDLIAIDGALWLPDAQHVVVSGRQRSAAPQRLWLFSVASDTLRPLTHDLSDYTLAGLSDTKHVLAVRGEVARSLWTLDVRAGAAPQEIAQNAGDLGEFEGLAWLSGDEVLYTAAEDENVDIWAASVSRRLRRRLTSDPADEFHPSATADGETVVFASRRGSAPGIWTMNRDGSDQKRLTTGTDVRPSISRDGRMLVFQRGAVDTTPFTLWRLARGEPTPTEVTDQHAMRPALSPDGASIAHYWMTLEAWLLAVTPTAGGLPAWALPISETHAARVVRWSPDGQALAYIDGAGGASNIWLQPLDGGQPRKLTHFAEGRISTFDWSPDGSKLVWMRLNEVRDVVALSVDARRH
jgi:Tol biopolymer transport system component